MSEPTPPPQPHAGSPGAAWLGGILIVLGIIFFAGQQLNIDISAATWPLYVIVPGLALLTLGLTQRRGSGLTIAGSVVTMVGLVLLYQNATDHWESWAYAWALVGPGGTGIGRLLYGTRSRDAQMAREGFWTILTAVGLFAVGLVFFEGIIGISGERLPLPQWVLPVAVIVIGVLVLVRGLTYRDGGGSAWPGEQPESGAESSSQEGETPSDEATTNAGPAEERPGNS